MPFQPKKPPEEPTEPSYGHTKALEEISFAANNLLIAVNRAKAAGCTDKWIFASSSGLIKPKQ